ncbi:type II toxin-antitoxin system Phd/YefM family antitoxin [Deinococcus planocerae]|uniref:type II toxin-antitoxin system Phd/YefM family antitoxin n=1 Tax=Deinococcus planocerae TaxID=1737569 RepID=UPI000C7F2D3A|nr:hypothetical protein [Deinococcus planocerae]
MTKTVDFEQFAAQMSQFLREAEAGETIVITRDGKPALQLQAAGARVERQTAEPLMTAWDIFKDAPRASSEEEELPLPERGGRDRGTPFHFDG